MLATCSVDTFLIFPGLRNALVCAIAAILGLLNATPGFAWEHFPRAAFVSENGCRVRCGPGEDYYTTTNLPGGVEVAIYRRAMGGWLAIRPPRDDYSWVPNDDLRIDDATQTARVLRDGVVAWMNAEDAASPDRWQVRLHIDERVRVIGPPERLAFHGQPARWWRRIAPPSGEFRWIHEGDLVDPPGQVAIATQTSAGASALLQKDSPASSGPANGSGAQANDHQTNDHQTNDHQTNDHQTNDHQTNDHQANDNQEPGLLSVSSAARAADEASSSDSPAGTLAEASVVSDSESVTERLARMEAVTDRLESAFRQLDGLVQPAQYATWRRRGASEEASVEGATLRRRTDQPRDVRFRDRNRPDEALREAYPNLDEPEFQQALIQLDADLSLMVARPTPEWSLEALKRRAVALVEGGPSALHRGRAALLLDSIHGFEQLHMRFVATENMASDLAASRRGARTIEQDLSTPTTRNEARTPRESSTSRGEGQNRAAAINVDRIQELGEPSDYRSPTGSGLREPGRLQEVDAEEPRDRTAGGPDVHFDAVGVLRRVHSERRITPPFALMDENGDMVTLITPAPGLNLRRYLGKRIGVFGPQRNLPSFQRDLLTAERVVRMEGLR